MIKKVISLEVGNQHQSSNYKDRKTGRGKIAMNLGEVHSRSGIVMGIDSRMEFKVRNGFVKTD